MKIKARFKKCSKYPNLKDDQRFNVVVEVDYISLYGYGEKIKHMAGIAEDDLEYYHCWNHEDIEIIEFER